MMRQFVKYTVGKGQPDKLPLQAFLQRPSPGGTFPSQTYVCCSSGNAACEVSKGRSVNYVQMASAHFCRLIRA